MSIQGLNNIQINPINSKGIGKTNGPIDKSNDFANQLQNVLDKKGPSENVIKKPLEIKFSNHAVERMRSRGIHFAPETLERIDSAVSKVQEKGAKETLVMSDEAAMIINVENKTVVTVMDKSQLKENVFTNIDAAVLV